MARMVTVGNVIARARKRADMVHTRFIQPEDALEMLNECYGELYDLLVASFQNYFVADPQFIQLVPGTVAYDLPDDFYKTIALELVEGDGTFSNIFVYNELEKNSTIRTDPNSIPNMQVRHRYIPAPQYFTSVDDEIDGIAGWDALLVYDLAIMFLQTEESDTTALERRRASIAARIQAMAQNRDVTQPGSITDTSVFDDGLIKDRLRYRFYGDTIEFLQVEYTGV